MGGVAAESLIIVEVGDRRLEQWVSLVWEGCRMGGVVVEKMDYS